MTKEKVPLQVAWLSENGLLIKAGKLLGYTFARNPEVSMKGIVARMESGPVHTTSGTRKALEEVFLEWGDHLLFTVAQLLELNFFDPGEFKYCPHCGKLQVDCDREQQAIYDHNHMYDNEGEQDAT